MAHDYAAVVERIESVTTTEEDRQAVMALLLADESAAAKPVDATVAQGELPDLTSCHSFDVFVNERYAHDVAGLHDAGRCEDGHYFGFEHRGFGNDYGESTSMGGAMWAAFVRLVARVDREEEEGVA